MELHEIQKHCPSNWDFPSDYLTELSEYSSEYTSASAKVTGNFLRKKTRICRVENPYLYVRFKLHCEEYSASGSMNIVQLFHDTCEDNIPSIVENNLDRRYCHRVKYGRGVSFSPSTSYANRQSSMSNGDDRAMIIADVVVGMKQIVNDCKDLPTQGYDTTVGNCGNVYVKYYDDEFYPKYVVYYENSGINNRRRVRYW